MRQYSGTHVRTCLDIFDKFIRPEWLESPNRPSPLHSGLNCEVVKGFFSAYGRTDRPPVTVSSVVWLKAVGVSLVQTCEVYAAGGVKCEKFAGLIATRTRLGAQTPL